MQTRHETVFSSSGNMEKIPDQSIDLVVTSPPYPMIEMWDEMFISQNPEIKEKLLKGDGKNAFELMHRVLDQTWKEVWRVLKPGGFACINIGDATRTLDNSFTLYTNHARILTFLQNLGFSSLPSILWRKQTNAPNKFMGSGMLPAGAYVTLEHENILILRKGRKREFKSEEDKIRRRESALFWEERNQWFSDIWFDIKGISQTLDEKKTRKRSAAFPFELAYRLINMYSLKEDVVLDPFLGLGTTAAAAMASARNSIGFEIDKNLRDKINCIKDMIIKFSFKLIRQRLLNHLDFLEQRNQINKQVKHRNIHYSFPVMTFQEKDILINDLVDIFIEKDNSLKVFYSLEPQQEFITI